MNIFSLKQHLVEGMVTYDFTLHLRVCDHTADFGGVLGRPLGTFFWAPTISWSRLLACVWTGPKFTNIVISTCSKFIQMPTIEINFVIFFASLHVWIEISSWMVKFWMKDHLVNGIFLQHCNCKSIMSSCFNKEWHIIRFTFSVDDPVLVDYN